MRPNILQGIEGLAKRTLKTGTARKISPKLQQCLYRTTHGMSMQTKLITVGAFAY